LGTKTEEGNIWFWSASELQNWLGMALSSPPGASWYLIILVYTLANQNKVLIKIMIKRLRTDSEQKAEQSTLSNVLATHFAAF